MGFNGQLIGPPPIHIVETEVDGDISLYDTQEERVIVLNPTASDVWRLADGDMTTDEIAETLSKAYGSSVATIRPDVESLLESLIDQGLLPAV